VTIGACDVRMRAFESKPRLAPMVKLRRLPTGHRVTVCAFLAAAAVVHIVRRVACGALARRAAVLLTHVAGAAGNVTVLFAQREVRLLVVKGCVLPRTCRMATVTIRAEATAVRVIRTVTRDARDGGLAKRYSRAMACVTSERRVRAIKVKVGELMIEALAAQM
jgi:hypothetical protein